MLTQSGYQVIPTYGDPRIKRLVVGGVSIAPGVLDGDVWAVMQWVAHRFHTTVCALKAGQCWGYAPRSIRGGTGWSNHASGTAIDLNASMFPQGQRRMTAAQVKACRAIVAESHGAIRWGGDYGGGTLVDQQHFEIASVAAVRAFVAKLRAPKPIPPVQEDDMPTAKEVVAELLSTKIRVTDAAQGPHGTTSEETVRDILARVVRVTALTQDAVRKDALDVNLNPEAIKQIADAVKEALQ